MSCPFDGLETIQCQEVIIQNKKKKKSKSKIFNHILFCLKAGRHSHMLRFTNVEQTEFEVKLINKKSPDWTKKDISLFAELDSLSSKPRPKKKYAESTKGRYKSNMSKLKRYIKEISSEKDKETPCVTIKKYRILQQPPDAEKEIELMVKKQLIAEEKRMEVHEGPVNGNISCDLPFVVTNSGEVTAEIMGVCEEPVNGNISYDLPGLTNQEVTSEIMEMNKKPDGDTRYDLPVPVNRDTRYDLPVPVNRDTRYDLPVLSQGDIITEIMDLNERNNISKITADTNMYYRDLNEIDYQKDSIFLSVLLDEDRNRDFHTDNFVLDFEQNCEEYSLKSNPLLSSVAETQDTSRLSANGIYYQEENWLTDFKGILNT